MTSNFRFSFKQLTAAVVTALALAPLASQAFDQNSLPEAVRVAPGHKVMLETVGKGEITYECRAKKDMADQFEWVFVGPVAQLNNRQGQAVGKYYGPPATWEANDGSKVTATQLAVAPGGAGNLPLQLVKANPAMGMGAMQGVAFIQRVATLGGVAPSAPCTQAQLSQKQIVGYQADYIFWQVQ
ncbi:DUF3455 domain-containing protein [Curvibacter sp. HBC61]|uniref:DUF3455 domain-containing protein n=1 Tax=Curvibacter cyanobacteriorum TaxID=3026422 RepID=A0ABT5MXH4_9BURK|nr:DUF3455 domain-containing protein [Curvibacter sp. HBC61]MDD0837458.1 DUF3455 domain-containing protein [Curvibacter sp. HBC61]